MGRRPHTTTTCTVPHSSRPQAASGLHAFVYEEPSFLSLLSLLLHLENSPLRVSLNVTSSSHLQALSAVPGADAVTLLLAPHSIPARKHCHSHFQIPEGGRRPQVSWLIRQQVGYPTDTQRCLPSDTAGRVSWAWGLFFPRALMFLTTQIRGVNLRNNEKF